MVGHAIEVKATFDARGRPRRGARGAAGVPEPRSSRTRRRRSRPPAATRRSSAACACDLADPRSLNFFVVGDNLLKGAALNTVQIAELAVERGLVGARGLTGSRVDGAALQRGYGRPMEMSVSQDGVIAVALLGAVRGPGDRAGESAPAGPLAGRTVVRRGRRAGRSP